MRDRQMKENQAAYKTVCDSLKDSDDRTGFTYILAGVLMGVTEPDIFKKCIEIATAEYCKFQLQKETVH